MKLSGSRAATSIFSGHRRAEDFELLPLARRRLHQPDDHWQQMDAGPQGGGSRRRLGERGQALLRDGGRPGQIARRPFRRHAGSRVGWRQRTVEAGPYHRVKKPFRTVLSCARRCMTKSGWPANACTSWSRWWPTAANSSFTRRMSTIFPSRMAGSSPKSATIAADYFLKQWDKFQTLPLGRAGAFDARARHWHVENGVEKCRVQVTLATAFPKPPAARSTWATGSAEHPPGGICESRGRRHPARPESRRNASTSWSSSPSGGRQLRVRARQIETARARLISYYVSV